jgi:DNA-binding CsgD family transcriptional regulator
MSERGPTDPTTPASKSPVLRFPERTGAAPPADSDPGPTLRLSDMAAPTVLVLFITLAIGFDLVDDILDGAPLHHLIGMVTGALLSVICLALMWRLLRTYRRQTRQLETALDATRADLLEWRAKAAETLQGLGALIDRQVGAWGLSPAERDVALFLLKGLSLKEIACLRDASERTVRQQAQAVYSKAGLAGRAELAAFFLEDLLLPPAQPADSPPRKVEQRV